MSHPRSAILPLVVLSGLLAAASSPSSPTEPPTGPAPPPVSPAPTAPFGGAQGPVAFVFHDGGTRRSIFPFTSSTPMAVPKLPWNCAPPRPVAASMHLLEVRDEKSALGSGPSGRKPVGVQVPPRELSASR